MTAQISQPSSSETWMSLEKATQSEGREKIARWCRDGVLGSRAAKRVSRIGDLDTAAKDTITEEDVTLDPADWAANALGNLQGPHWLGGDAHFNCEESPIHNLRTNLLWYGGTLYQIQVNRDDLKSLRASAASKGPGRPRGGGYKKSDEPIVEKMRVALANGDFTSPTAAAEHFASEAKGGGTPKSKAARLARLYMASENAAGN